jgi:hypothetical protein
VFSSNELQRIVAANEKSRLNAFQQKFVHALTGYISFVKQLNDDFRNFPDLPTGVALPQPI